MHGVAHLRTQQGPGGRRCCSRCRSEAQVRARLLARIDAGRDQDVERLRLFQRIDRVVADPHKLEPGLVHALPDHMVERVLDPRLERHKPFLRRLLAQGLARRPVDLRDEGERIWTPVMRYRVASASRRSARLGAGRQGPLGWHDRQQRLVRPRDAILGEDLLQRLDEGRVQLIVTLVGRREMRVGELA